MSRNFSNSFKKNINSTNSTSVALELLTLEHPDLPTPIYLVRNNEDITSNGQRYIACNFELDYYADVENQAPVASVSIDNVGRELTSWIELSNGAKNLKFTISVIESDNPDDIQYTYFAYLKNISMDNKKVNAEISLDDILNKRAVNRLFNGKYAPGLY